MTAKPLALIDFYDGMEGRGIPSIIAAAESCGYKPVLFDLRRKNEIPALKDFDVFISSGGPGDPNVYGEWGPVFFNFAHELFTYNKQNPDKPKDYFAICHSFQMLAHDLKMGVAGLRPEGRLSGIHTQEKIHGELPEIVAGLPDRFDTLENRFYEVVLTGGHPDFIPFAKREHALTGMVSRDGHFIGTQFHPEATVQGVAGFINDPDNRKTVTELHGAKTLQDMLGRMENVAVSHGLLIDFLHRSKLPSFF
ncbi:MAG: synthase - glutamine amidotransferase domain-like protein [Alphaproteobacteria bacterium]|nr:synthase - glutamine amidotransferase domain-like protein [Alphaproteobacteria bacterium]